MRILHVISSGGMYGAESVILNLIRTLEQQGHTGILGIFSNSKNPNLQLHDFALSQGIESHLIPCQGQIDFTVPSSIGALASEKGADVVHAHGYKADVYSYLALRSSRRALVSTCHNWLDDGHLVRIYGMLDRYVLRHFGAVIAVSEEVRNTLADSGVSPGKIHLIKNGIDLEPFEAAAASLRDRSEPSGLLVGWIGRLSPEKGPDLFVRMAHAVHKHFPTTRFLLVGDGPDRSQLESLIGELQASSYVHLVGRRTDMAAVYASFDVLVSSSRREGLPMAILEGMASSLPWVATSVGDVPAVVIDGQSGLVVPPEDADSLARAVTELLSDGKRRSAMGANAKRRVEDEFSAHRMTRDYLSVYNEVLASSSPHHGTAVRFAAGRS